MMVSVYINNGEDKDDYNSVIGHDHQNNDDHDNDDKRMCK